MESQVINIKANGKMANFKGNEYIMIQKEGDMKVSGKMAEERETEFN